MKIPKKITVEGCGFQSFSTHWDKFKRLDFCAECKTLQQEEEFDEVCPECGNPSYEKVIARWKIESFYNPFGLQAIEKTIEYEIRE